MNLKDRLAHVTDVYYHASCPDGTAAAMVVADTFAALEWKAEYHPIQYGTDEHEKILAAPGQLFVDITPPRSRWEEWKSLDPVVLDHHESAKHVTDGLDGVYRTNEAHSGAKLAYENVALQLCGGNDEWKKFVELAMVRDTWKKDHPLWRDACAQAYALSLFGSERLIGQVVQGTFRHDRLQEVGEILFHANTRSAQRVAETSMHMLFKDARGAEYRLATFNSTEKVVSDAANILVDAGVDVAIGYFYTFEDGTPRAIVSVRTGGRLSARAIAEANGGGGHDRASGFKIDGAQDVSPSTIANLVFETVRSFK